MLDRHADVVNADVRENLGGWIRSRLKNGVEARTHAAKKEISRTQLPVAELRAQWSQQRTAQLSVKARKYQQSSPTTFTLILDIDAPSKLKRELDAVLNLQTELTAIEGYFQRVKKAISEDSNNPEVLHFLESLRRTHEKTLGKLEDLYTSLNVGESFPEIQGLPLEFVRTLLLARDLKINIRKRAIGTFFEWERLDQAAGGRDQPLGEPENVVQDLLLVLTSTRNQAPSTDAHSHIEAHTGVADRDPQVQQASGRVGQTS